MDRQSQQFVVFNNAKLCCMFRSIRPSSGTNVHNLRGKKQAKYIKIMFKNATSRKICNYHNIGILKKETTQIHKIKYLIIQCYDNCIFCQISQIPTYFNVFRLFFLKLCTFVPEDGRIDRNM